MTTPVHQARREILLLEPNSMTGSIIVATARQLGLPHVRQINSVRHAQAQLQSSAFGSMIVSLDEPAETVDLLQKLRASEFAAPPDMPVAITTSLIDADTANS